MMSIDMSKYLKLDQTTPQTIYNGLPLLEATRTIDADNQIVDKKYVDDAVEVENLWDRAGTILSPHTAGDDITTTGDITANNLSNTNTGDQDLSGLVPYTGANADVDLGAYDLYTTGNVGIGIDSPVALLNIKTPNGFNRAIKIGANNQTIDDGAYIEFTSSSLDGYGAQIGGIREGAGAANALVFLTGKKAQEERLRITNGGNIGIGTDSPDTKLQVVGTTKFGEDTTNYTNTESDGTIVFNGNAVVWKDINLGAAQLSRPSSSQPDLATFVDENGDDTEIQTYGFDIGEKIHGSFEMQHDYKEGSDFTFHTHWQGITAPSGTDNVQWRLTYVLMRDGTTLNAVTTIDSPDATIDTQYMSVRSDFAAITGTNYKIGDQFLFTLERVASTGDAYAGDALIATTGIHYQIDTVGSREIVTK